MSHALLFGLAGLVYMSGNVVLTPDRAYTISRQIMGWLQSPIIAIAPLAAIVLFPLLSSKLSPRSSSATANVPFVVLFPRSRKRLVCGFYFPAAARLFCRVALIGLPLAIINNPIALI
jgi:hypothetical protein